MGEGTKRWDRACLTLFGLSYFGTPVVAALDARGGPTPTMPAWLWVPGVLLFAFHLVTVAWAMSANPHFEKTVRIQHDRGHRVIDTGPYQFVRHPGYMSTIVGFALASPLLLLSWWAFVPAAACAACLVARTALEDRTLRTELPGYEEYAQRTRYRLLPGIW